MYEAGLVRESMGAPGAVIVQAFRRTIGRARNGTATASGTSITYTPAAGYAGSDSFTYTAANASGTSAPETVSVTIASAVPDAPTGATATSSGSGKEIVSFTDPPDHGCSSTQVSSVWQECVSTYRLSCLNYTSKK